MTIKSDDLRSSSEWRALLSETDHSRAADLYQSIAVAAARQHVPELISLAHSGVQQERVVALGILMAALRNQTLTLTKQQRSEILETLPMLLGRYPGPPGVTAFHMLQLLDPLQGEDFLLSRVQLSQLSDDELGIYLASLNFLPTSPSLLKRLEELSERSDRMGAEARSQLERRGALGVAAVQQIAEEWKRTKSRESLNRLFNAYISRQTDQAIAPVLELLGPPDEKKGPRYFFHTVDGVSLFLEENGFGRVKSMRIK